MGYGNTDGNDISNITNATNIKMKNVQALSTALLSIGNANGIDMSRVTGVATVGIGMYVYNSANNIMDRVEEKQKQQDEMMEAFEANVQAYTDEVLANTQHLNGF